MPLAEWHLLLIRDNPALRAVEHSFHFFLFSLGNRIHIIKGKYQECEQWIVQMECFQILGAAQFGDLKRVLIIISFLMGSNKGTQAKRKYSRISLKKREALVNLVVDKDFTIARAARRLAIRASTARMILNKYRRTGTYPIKNFKKPIPEVRKPPKRSLPMVKTEDFPVSTPEMASMPKSDPQALSKSQEPEIKVEEPFFFPFAYPPFFYCPFGPYLG